MKIISETTSAPFPITDTILLIGFMIAMIVVFCVVIVRLFKTTDPFTGLSVAIATYIIFVVLLVAKTGHCVYCVISDNWPVYAHEMWVTFDSPEDAEAVLQNKDYQVLNDSADGVYHIRTWVKDP